MKKTVSIIVPVYNCEKYLTECLESIVRQTYHDIEIILINDGSTDTSAAICQRYADRDDRIVFYSQENSGSSHSRNVGMRLSQGEYIIFVDSDDVIPENICEIASSRMSDYDVMILDWKGFRNTAAIQCSDMNASPMVQPMPLDSNDKQAWIGFLIGGNKEISGVELQATTVWGKIYRSSFLKKHRIVFFEEMFFAEDLLFNLQVYMKTPKICYLPVNSYFYRYNDTSVVHRYNPGFMEEMGRLWANLEKILVSEGIWDDVQKDVASRRLEDLPLALSNDIFHYDNPKDEAERKADFFELIDQEEYRNASIAEWNGTDRYKRHVINMALQRKYGTLKIEYMARTVVRRAIGWLRK